MEFVNRVNQEKFRSTNKLWNELKLNIPWNVGYVSSLIHKRTFKSKEEWYDFYFQSGEERLKQINNLSNTDKSKILSKYPSKNNSLNELNFYYGRTKQEIAKLGSILYQELLKTNNPLKISEDECKFIAFFRVVCETWNGIVMRETNTKKQLMNLITKKGYEIDIINTSGKFDTKYAVDFEICYEGNIVCGLQVKPKSYANDNFEYLAEAKEMNKVKNDLYIKDFNRKIFYIYSATNGLIYNKEILNEIISELYNFRI